MNKYVKLFVLFAVMFVCCDVFAQNNLQDVVYRKDGSILRGIIIEQVPNESLKIQTTDGNVFVLQMSEIERMSKEESSIINRNAPQMGSLDDVDSLCYMGKRDAQENYTGKGSLSGVTTAVTILTSPLIGLIPAAIGSSSDVNDSKLDYPSQTLWKNKDYRDCYRKEATKIKSRKAWTAYGISSAIWLGLIVIISSAA